MPRLRACALVCFFSILFTLAVRAEARIDDQAVFDDIQTFQTNTPEFMKRVPPKRIVGRPLQAHPIFPLRGLDSSEARAARSHVRDSLAPKSSTFAASPGRLEFFIDRSELEATGGKFLRTLSEVDDQQLTTAQLSENPWSDSYWPTYMGQLGQRYASAGFQSSGSSWPQYYAYTQQADQRLADIYQSRDEEAIDRLSPSEKYDLLVGNLEDRPAGYLTPSMWEAGRLYQDRFGQVESWMGLCHGWAAASFGLPRPKHKVKVMAQDGFTDLTFYPADIKALTTLLWSNSLPQVRYIGTRCDAKDPKYDPVTGRIIDDGCFDVNPALWHMAIVHQIGLARRSLVMDATYDYEVWNQPILAYEYKYFDPQTGVTRETAAAATRPLAEYPEDRFRVWRSPSAVSLVGVAMDVYYMSETRPTQVAADGPESDAVLAVRYYYDLELNDRGEVIGGEWYQNAHPDFLWSLNKGTRASTQYDGFVTGAWDSTRSLNFDWSHYAKLAAPSSLPLAKIVEHLIELSQTPPRETGSGGPIFQPPPPGVDPTPSEPPHEAVPLPTEPGPTGPVLRITPGT